VPKTHLARNRIFELWSDFCERVGQTPCLRRVVGQEQKLCYLLVFGVRYRQAGQTNKPVRANTVEDALLAVGKGMADLGVPDPRKSSFGSNQCHPPLSDFLKAMRDQDDPSTRSYPVNTVVIRALYDALDTAHATEGTINCIAIDLVIVAFFWLLRPAECTDGGSPTSRSQAFRLCDVCLTSHGKQLCASDPSLNEVPDELIECGVLTFTDQKNGVRGEQVGHKATHDPRLCPCKALARLARRLRSVNAPSDTPICSYLARDGTLRLLKSTIITNALRHAAASVESSTGISPWLLSARSLRPGGATALLCAGVDKDAIQLLGRWKSDAMLRYLRIQAHTVSAHFSQNMLDHGGHTFAPGTHSDANADAPLPEQTPPAFLDVLQHTELHA
jgi:hypothetical protein